MSEKVCPIEIFSSSQLHLKSSHVPYNFSSKFESKPHVPFFFPEKRHAQGHNPENLGMLPKQRTLHSRTLSLFEVSLNSTVEKIIMVCRWHEQKFQHFIFFFLHTSGSPHRVFPFSCLSKYFKMNRILWRFLMRDWKLFKGKFFFFRKKSEWRFY